MVTHAEEDVVADCTVYAARWRLKAREKKRIASVTRACLPNKSPQLSILRPPAKLRGSVRLGRGRLLAPEGTDVDD